MHKDKKISSIYLYGTFAFVAGASLILLLSARSIIDTRPPEFSKKNMLQAIWAQYKLEYLEPGTFRSLDKDRDNVTTSEGQSYTMLRSVWLDDKEMFDAAWQWTKDNLQREEDLLISWLFGERPDGTYGVLESEGGYNTATDADVDIALALLFASSRWNEESYFGDAIGIIRDIWAKEVLIAGGKPYLVANNIEKSERKPYAVANPSYLAPYAYKIFARVDPDRDWAGLASTSYEVALESMRSPLDKDSSAKLPPDWIGIDKSSGEIALIDPSVGLTTNFSYDALRTPWRFAVDYAWTKDPRAKEVLDAMGFLSREWERKGSIATSYSHDGARLSSVESAAMYGGAIGYFMVSDPSRAEEVYRSKLESLFDSTESKWRERQGYYDDNWAWFGMALYAGEIRDLSLKKNER
ncbi:MAG: hypothetical protein HZA81_02590 [Candidatus Taylorbacteria bacterium]|nr:hypothetical protein [Candidatus Taylorbacteria bacterium]